MKLFIYILLDIAVGLFGGWVEYSNQISMGYHVIDFGYIVTVAICGMVAFAAWIEIPVWDIWENYQTEKFWADWERRQTNKLNPRMIKLQPKLLSHVRSKL